jgi:hypothetical protein
VTVSESQRLTQKEQIDTGSIFILVSVKSIFLQPIRVTFDAVRIYDSLKQQQNITFSIENLKV